MNSLPAVLNFCNFLNESKEEKGVELLILSGTVKPSPTSKSFLEECQKRGIPCYVVNINNVQLEKIYNGHLIRETSGDKREIFINPDVTAIIPRRGVISNSLTKQIMRELEASRYFCVNSLESIEVCESKFLTSKVLEENELPVPRYALVNGEENLDTALEQIGGQFPVVMKLLSGTQGIGVSIVDSYASLKSVYQTIAKLDPEKEILIQEKIDSNFDLRIQVILKRFDPLITKPSNCIILGSMKREAVKKDFRTNYSLGGKVSAYNIDDKIADLACRAANSVGSHWCGVDIMIDKKTKEPYILEVNSSPGTEGISQAIGRPIVGDVIDYVINKKNWIYSRMEVGYLETIEIPEIGKLVAKFDTGNGSSASSIQADEMKEVGNQLKWKIGGKEFTSDIVGYTDTEVGRDKSKRPIILIDVMLNGVKISDVKVAPTDRVQKSTPFLASRGLMKKMGVMVNPHKAFVVTEEIKGYRPLKAKGKPHLGIEFS